MRSAFRSFALSLSLACALAAPAAAQDYPSKPISMVIGYAPGGTTDIVARLLAPALEKELGQPVIVENKPGGGAAIATEFVAAAPADGYTLLLALPAFTISPSIQTNVKYDVHADFAPVAMVGIGALALFVNSQQPFSTVQELIDYAKAHPGELSYATSGPGTSPHMTMELFKAVAGLDIVHLPYKGGAPALTGVVSGEAQLAFDSIVGVKPQADAGAIKFIGVSIPTRSPVLPDVPTMAEAGVPDFNAGFWMGMLVPDGTPQPVVDKLNGAINKVITDEAVKARMLEFAIEPRPGTPADLADLIDREIEQWAEVVEKAGLAQQ